MSQPAPAAFPLPEPPTLLSPKQEAALLAVLGGASDSEAAERIGTTRQTIARWRHTDPVFVAALARERRETWDRNIAAFRSLFGKAVTVLHGALDDPAASVRLKAVEMVLRTVGAPPESFAPKHGLPETPDEVMTRWQAVAAERRRDAAMDAWHENLMDSLTESIT